MGFGGKISCLAVHIYLLPTNPPPADALFTEVAGALSIHQAAALDFLHFSLVHFSLLRSTLHSFLSTSFYSENVRYQSMLWIKVEYIVTRLGQ